MRTSLLSVPKLFAIAGACVLGVGAIWVYARTPSQAPQLTVSEFSDAPAPRAEPAQPLQPPAELIGVLPDELHAAGGMDFLNMQLFYVCDDQAARDTEYLTLDEALRSGVAGIRDTGAYLTAYNLSDKPVFGMAGDLLLGGTQDRILASGIVLEPNSKDVHVKAFCVEKGRHTSQTSDRGLAYDKHFYADDDRAQVDLRVRRAAIRDDKQDMVWQAVAMSNKALGLEGANATGTVRQAFSSRNVQVEAQVMALEAATRLDDRTVGFALVADGRVAAMDVFESNGLCRKVSAKLLKSYAMTALLGELALPDKADEHEAHPAMVEEPLSEEARARQRRAITPRIERKGNIARSTLVNSERQVHVCLIGY